MAPPPEPPSSLWPPDLAPFTPLEIAAGLLVGEEPSAPALPPPERGSSPLAALENAVRPALARPPCVVAFSGGRDSSAVLAVATRLAQREGWQAPVPVTLRFPDVASTHENEWQEQVVQHLGLSDWERIELGEELSCLGPTAATLLTRYGFPLGPTAQLLVPLCAAARRGSLLTGAEGDGIFGLWRWQRLADVLARRTRPEPRDALRLLHATAPARVRSLLQRKDPAAERPWLRPPAQAEFWRAWKSWLASEPVRWPARVAWYARQRAVVLAHALSQQIAADMDVTLHDPLLDPRFLAQLARAGGTTGWGDRTAVVRAVFGSLLPSSVIARTSKATFDNVAWRTVARQFAAEWNGGGVDPGLVDADALRREWSKPTPNVCSMLALQAAWLASRNATKAHEVV